MRVTLKLNTYLIKSSKGQRCCVSLDKIPSFIYLLGPEGAGKTTLIRRLVEWLKRKRIKVVVVEIRSVHLLVIFVKKIKALLVTISGRAMHQKAPRITPNPHARKMWNLLHVLDFFNIIVLAFVRVYLPLFFGYTVVAERYVIDSVSDCLFVNSVEGENVLLKNLFLRLLYFLPRGYKLIYLDADYATLTDRYKERGSRIEPKRWIEFQQRTYKRICKEMGGCSVLVDGKSVNEIFEEILSHLQCTH